MKKSAAQGLAGGKLPPKDELGYVSPYRAKLKKQMGEKKKVVPNLTADEAVFGFGRYSQARDANKHNDSIDSARAKHNAIADKVKSNRSAK